MSWLRESDRTHEEDSVLYGMTFADIMLLLENDRQFMYPEDKIRNATVKDIATYRKYRMLELAKREMMQSVRTALETLEKYADDIIKATAPREKVIDGDVKTAQGWEDSGLSFEKYVKEYELVDEGIIAYFANVLPPENYNSHLLQFGEPSDSVKEGQRYLTFVYGYTDPKYGEVWQYQGRCLSGGMKKGTEIPII